MTFGRTTKTIAAYTDGTVTNASNQTTEYTYDGSNHLLTQTARLTGNAFQTTQYLYGVSQSTGSGLDSNDILSAIRYPDGSSGNSSSSQQESYTVNALGETKTKTDRNGSVHSYSRNVLGRLTDDTVTTLGSNVNGSVRRLSYTYTTLGANELDTSYSDTAGTTIVNQVQRVYNGLGELITEYQSASGAVNTSTTPKVQYSYDLSHGGGCVTH